MPAVYIPKFPNVPIKLLWVEESFKFSANAGAHAEYA